MQNFKQFPYQNYIQLRFNNRNLSHLNSQEILLKYKRNASVLSKIFSFQRNHDQSQDIKKDEQVLITRYKFKQQVEQQQKEAQKKITLNAQSRDKFQELLSQSYKVNSRQQLGELITKLKQYELYDETHPYLVQSSPFFMNSTTQQVLEVTLRVQQQKSFFNEQQLVFEQLN